MAGLRIEISVTAAGVDGTVTDPDIGEIARIIVACRNVARPRRPSSYSHRCSTV